MVEQAPKEEKKNSVGSMKTGDYMIHVYIQKGKAFKAADADATTVDPIILVETCKMSKYTAGKSGVPCGTQNPQIWKEHLFFEPRGVHSSSIEGETITIKVMNKGLFRDELIGRYDFDITQVYFKEKHALQHQWVALFNPESANFSDISGYLLVSIAVQGPGDEQVQLEDQTGVEAENAVVMMPAQIKKEFKQLKLRFIKGIKLPKMDNWGTIDAYIITKFNGKEMRTKTVTARGDETLIEHEFWLPIQWPLASDRLVLKLYDQDATTDEIVGSMFFSLKKLCAEGDKKRYPTGKFFWQNLYGAPVDFTGSVATLMNDNPEMGSAWKGRILMHVECEDADHPERRSIDLDENFKKDIQQLSVFKEREYEIIAEVGLGIVLPANNTKYKVMIKIGEFEMMTQDPKEYKKGYNRWSERINQQTMKTHYQSVEEMQHVYFYLMDGKTPICYYKAKATDFTKEEAEFKWLDLKTDKAIDKVPNQYDAGMIQVKLSIYDKAKNGGKTINFKDFNSWKKQPPRRLGSKKIRCFIFQCRNIPSADEDGSSDSYITVWNPEVYEKPQLYTTQVIEDNLNPIYLDTIEMLYDMADLDSAPPIVFNIWDEDRGVMGKSADYLGRAVIYLHDANSNLSEHKSEDDAYCNRIPKPKWHKIRIGFDESQPPCGEVLCSFIIARDDFDFQTPSRFVDLDKTIPKQDYMLEVNVLGLRNLESFGLMPIKKPYIKFRVKSLLPPAKAQAITNVQTDPGASGANPNINTMLNFFVQLPKENLFCPSLECDVYDYVYLGLTQPLIGTFTIPIGDIKEKTAQRWSNDLEEERKIIETLEKLSKKSKEEIEKQIRDLQGDFKQVFKGDMQKRLKEKAASEIQGGWFSWGAASPGDTESQIVTSNRRDGYGQMVDIESGAAANPSAVELRDVQEKDPLLAKSDSLFENLKADDPLMVSKVAYEQAKKELDEFLSVRADPKQQSQKSDNQKTKLQQNLLVTQKKFKEEEKKAKQVQRELQYREMKANENSGANCNIILPVYEFQPDLKFYQEIDAPHPRLYKPIGFNDNQRIKIMMEGDDNDKRSSSSKDDIKNLQKAIVSAGVARSSTMKRNARNQANNVIQVGEETKEQKEARMQTELQARYLKMTNKHYRKYYEDELENDKTLFSENNMPFINIDIKRGQSRGLKKSWFSFFSADKVDDSGEVTNEKVVGKFKGRIRVFNKEDEEGFRKKRFQNIQRIFELLNIIHRNVKGSDLPYKPRDINSAEKLDEFKLKIEQIGVTENRLIEFLKDQGYERIIQKQLLTQTQCKVIVYLLEGFDFASRDIGSASDPYIIVRCGDREFNERENYQLDQPNPTFYKLYQFTASFPGASMLEIEAYDYDDLFGDDLIGRTTLDLDDRFFNPDWQSMEEKPIEYRQIYHESTSLSQGVVTMWLDIEVSNKANKEEKVWDISPEPKKDYEIRVSVLETKNVPKMDGEGLSDVFIKAYIDDKNKLETDTHFRCADGNASFNWRLKFDATAPRKDPLVLVLQAWDFDLFSANDYICEWVIDLETMFKNVRQSQTPATLNQMYFESLLKNRMKKEDTKMFEFSDEDDSFWISTTYGPDNRIVKLRLDIRIFPKEQAKTKDNGIGRQEPNQYPYLPPPVGRIQFSLNPFTMLKQLLGPELFNKLFSMLCVVLCCALCIMMLPMILSNFASEFFLNLFGLK